MSIYSKYSHGNKHGNSQPLSCMLETQSRRNEHGIIQ